MEEDQNREVYPGGKPAPAGPTAEEERQGHVVRPTPTLRWIFLAGGVGIVVLVLLYMALS